MTFPLIRLLSEGTDSRHVLDINIRTYTEIFVVFISFCLTVLMYFFQLVQCELLNLNETKP